MSKHLTIATGGGTLSVQVLNAVIDTEVGPITLTGDQFAQLVGTGTIEQPAPAPTQPAPTEPAPAPTDPVVYTNAATLKGIEYATVEEAILAATVGDTVYVNPGVWEGPVAYASIDRDITVEGILGPNGERPELRGTSDRLEWGKAILLPRTDNCVIRNLKITNARNSDDNGAAIRSEPGCKRILVDNCELTENENGLLIPPDAGLELTIKNSKIHKNGWADTRRGYSHNIYVNAIGRLNIVDSIIRDSYFGHEVKSRAYETYIDGAYIVTGTEGCAIDLPDGGLLRVTKSDFFKPAGANRKHMMSLCAESVATDGRVHDFRIEDTLIDNQRDGTRAVQTNNHPSVPVVYASDVSFVGDETFEGLYTRE